MTKESKPYKGSSNGGVLQITYFLKFINDLAKMTDTFTNNRIYLVVLYVNIFSIIYQFDKGSGFASHSKSDILDQ